MTHPTRLTAATQRSRIGHCQKHASARFAPLVRADQHQFRRFCTSGPVNYEGITTYASDGSIHRYYDPSTDQFISVDPLVSVTGQPFSYADDDPVNGSDGLCGSLGEGVQGPWIPCTPEEISIESVMANPNQLAGMTPNQVQKALGTTPGWIEGRLNKGSNAGSGWALRQLAEECSADDLDPDTTGRQILWNPYSTHHLEYPDGYFNVSSGDLGEQRVAAAPATGALVIPNEPGFASEEEESPTGGGFVEDLESWLDGGGLGGSTDDG